MTGTVLIQIAICGGVFYLFLNLYALFASNRKIFRPQTPSYDRLSNEVRILSGNGEKISAVYLKNTKARYTILFSHGNAEDLGKVVPFMSQFHLLGYSVLMYDYRGYGTSEGTPSERKVYQDIEAVYRWLVEQEQIPPETIIAHGRSLGGAPATWLAASYPVGGLVLESTFVSAFRVKTHWPLLPWDKLNSLRRMKEVSCSVLVMHGTEDEIIPLWHGKKLYTAAPKTKKNLWITAGHHTDYAYVAGPDYIRTFQDFIKQLSVD